MSKLLPLFVFLVVVAASIVTLQYVKVDLSQSGFNLSLAVEPVSDPSPICSDLPSNWRPAGQDCNTNLSSQQDRCRHFLQCWSLGVTGQNGPTAGYTRTSDGRYCREPYAGDPDAPTQQQYAVCLRQGGGAAGGSIPFLPGGNISNGSDYSLNAITPEPITVSDITFDPATVPQGGSFHSAITGTGNLDAATFGAVYTFNDGSDIVVANWQRGAEHTHQLTTQQPGKYTIKSLLVNYDTRNQIVWRGERTIIVTVSDNVGRPTYTSGTTLSGRVTDRNGNPINGVQLYNDSVTRPTTANTTGGNAGACQAWPGTGPWSSPLPRNGRVVLGGANSGWCTAMIVYLGSAGSYAVQYDPSAQVFFIDMAAPPTAVSDVGYTTWGSQTSEFFFFGLEGAASYACSWNGTENTFLDPRLGYNNRCECPDGAQNCQIDSEHLPPLPNSFKSPDTRSGFNFISNALAAITDYIYRPGKGNLKIGTSASNGEIVFDGEFINYLNGLSPSGAVSATNGNRTLVFPDNLGRYFSNLVVRYEKGAYKTTKTFSLSGSFVDLSASLNIAGTTPATTTTTLPPVTTTTLPPVNIPTPKISSFSPLVAAPGDTVTVKGSNFSAGNCGSGMGASIRSAEVLIGGETVTTSDFSAKTLRFEAPNIENGSYYLQVVSGGCVTRAGRVSGYSSRLLSIVNSASDPTIYYAVPLVLRPGKNYTVTVYGTNLSDVLSVTSESGDLDINADTISTTPFSGDKVKIKFGLSVSPSADRGLQYLILEDDSGNSVRFNLVVQ